MSFIKDEETEIQDTPYIARSICNYIDSSDISTQQTSQITNLNSSSTKERYVRLTFSRIDQDDEKSPEKPNKKPKMKYQISTISDIPPSPKNDTEKSMETIQKIKSALNDDDSRSGIVDNSFNSINSSPQSYHKRKPEYNAIQKYAESKIMNENTFQASPLRSSQQTRIIIKMKEKPKQKRHYVENIDEIIDETLSAQSLLQESLRKADKSLDNQLQIQSEEKEKRHKRHSRKNKIESNSNKTEIQTNTNEIKLKNATTETDQVKSEKQTENPKIIQNSITTQTEPKNDRQKQSYSSPSRYTQPQNENIQKKRKISNSTAKNNTSPSKIEDKIDSEIKSLLKKQKTNSQPVKEDIKPQKVNKIDSKPVKEDVEPQTEYKIDSTFETKRNQDSPIHKSSDYKGRTSPMRISELDSPQKNTEKRFVSPKKNSLKISEVTSKEVAYKAPLKVANTTNIDIELKSELIDTPQKKIFNAPPSMKKSIKKEDFAIAQRISPEYISKIDYSKEIESEKDILLEEEDDEEILKMSEQATDEEIPDDDILLKDVKEMEEEEDLLHSDDEMDSEQIINSLKHDSPRKIRDSDESLSDFLQVEAQIKNDHRGMGLTFFPIECQRIPKKESEKPVERTITNFSKIISYLRTKVDNSSELHAIKLRLSQFNHNHLCVLIENGSHYFRGVYVLNEIDQVLTKIWGDDIPETIEPSSITHNFVFLADKKIIEEFHQEILTQKTEIFTI